MSTSRYEQLVGKVLQMLDHETGAPFAPANVAAADALARLTAAEAEMAKARALEGVAVSLAKIAQSLQQR